MGHASASDLLAHFHCAIKGFQLNKIVQVSIDGPNVNWKFLEQFQSELKRKSNVTLMNVGSCGLHVVNGAFQDSAKASGWEIDKLLLSAYCLFKDTPARHEDFTTGTKASDFPIKFCKHQWLEKVPVRERLTKMLPDLCQYVKAIKEGTVPDPKIKLYETIKQCCANHLVPARLAFFLSVSEKITRFLTQYQTDKPMLPFLYSDLFKFVKDLMGWFMNSDKMAGVTSMYQLLKIDVQAKENHSVYS